MINITDSSNSNSGSSPTDSLSFDENFDRLPPEGDTSPRGQSDSGQGSETDDQNIYAYHFLIHNSLCGMYYIIDQDLNQTLTNT